MKHLISSLIFTCSIVFASAAGAALSPDVAQRSTALLDSGNPQAAYELLASQQKTGPQDWFLFGMAAKQSGQMIQAEEAFKRAIQLDPARSGRVKLELATVSYALGANGTAEQLLNEVKAENPPPAVRQNIDRFLALIGDSGCHTEGSQRWCLSASASVMYDSNVNNATTADTVVMFGLPFTLSEDAKAQSDIAYTLSTSFDHIAVLTDETAWQSNVTVQWTDYKKLDEFDTLRFSASTGPVFTLDEQTILSVPFTADAVSYTERGDIYSSSVGVAPQLRHKLNEEVSLNLSGNINWKRFHDNEERNTFSYSIAPGIDLRACGTGTLRFGASLGREDSGIDTYSNDNWGLNASIFCSLGSNLALSLYGNYSKSDYDEREAAYDEARSDQKTTIGGSLQYKHQPSGLDVVLGLSHTRNNSNLTLYEYEKIQATASVKKKF